MTRNQSSSPSKTQQRSSHTSRWLTNGPAIPITILYTIGLGCILLGLSLQPIDHLVLGLWRIITSPSNLTTDYFAVGGTGATFVNVGVVLLVNSFIAHRTTKEVTGPLFAALFCVMAFSFFGKNIYNTIPLTLGSWLYSRFMGKPYSSVLLTSLFATGLSPVVSFISFGQGLPLWLGMPLGYLCGIFIGFIMPPVASSFLRFHQGYSLYNVGFACGVIGMLLTSVLRFFGLPVDGQSIESTTTEPIVVGFLLLLCAFFLILGLLSHPDFKDNYPSLLSHSGRAVTDFVTMYGAGTTYLNIGILGLLAIFYVYLVGGTFNGPVVGGILMVMGFAAYGKHLRNVIPIILGVLIAQLLTAKYDVHTTSSILSALFGTSLAPIAGQYGILPGLVAGGLHSTLTQNLSNVHAGLNLYHNGFAAAFIAATMVPILNTLEERRNSHA